VTIILAMFKFAVAVFALLLILIGLIVMPTPLPFGIIFVILGVLLLAAVAPAAVRGLRRRFRWFDRFMHWAERNLPEWLARRLRESDYEHEDSEDEEALFPAGRRHGRRDRRPRR